MESRGHCLLSKAEMSLQISVRVAEIKLISFGGGAGGKRNGSGNEMVKIWCGWREKEVSIWGLSMDVSLKDQC